MKLKPFSPSLCSEVDDSASHHLELAQGCTADSGRREVAMHSLSQSEYRQRCFSALIEPKRAGCQPLQASHDAVHHCRELDAACGR